jgi:hypothetical protein
VTKVYISYDNLQIRASGLDQSSGWIPVNVKGSIELLGTVNVSQTIASFHLPDGKYNMLRFNVSSAVVTYNGKNFTAFVVHSVLYVPFKSPVEVTNSKVTAAIIDIHPNVLNIRSHSNPEFVIKTQANGFLVPSTEVTDQTEREGHRETLAGKSWWIQIQQNSTATLYITTASLTGISFNATAKNVGTEMTTLRLVIVTPLASLVATDSESEHRSPLLMGSLVFAVKSDGTLTPLSTLVHKTEGETDDRPTVASAIFQEKGGYNLTGGASIQLAYKGLMTTGYGDVVAASFSIVAGQQYLITVVGEQSLASYVVVAG